MVFDNKEIGLRIRKIRESQKLSREKLSERSNISNQFLADIETGKKRMTIETLMKICNALSVLPNDILLGFGSGDENTEEIISMLHFADEKTVLAIKEIVRTVIRLSIQDHVTEEESLGAEKSADTLFS